MDKGLKPQHYYRCQQPHINPLAPIVKYTSHVNVLFRIHVTYT